MVRLLVAVAVVLLIAPRTGQAKTFEDLLKGARPVSHLSQVIGPFLQQCGGGGSLRDIQCRAIRARMQHRALRGTYTTTVPAVRVGPYDNTRLRFPLSVVGCLTCSGPARLDPSLYGKKPWYVTFGRPKRVRLKGGKPVFEGLTLAEVYQAVGPSQVEQWMKTTVPNLRVQFVYRTRGAKWSAGLGKGVSMELLGFRLYDQCTGKVLVSRPPSVGAAPVARAAGCAAPVRRVAVRVRPRRKVLPSRLGPHDILRGMKRLDKLVQQCYTQFQVPGLAVVKVTVLGKTGRVDKVEVLGKFKGSPTTGKCLLDVVRQARFPRFRSAKMVFRYRWYLR